MGKHKAPKPLSQAQVSSQKDKEGHKKEFKFERPEIQDRNEVTVYNAIIKAVNSPSASQTLGQYISNIVQFYSLNEKKIFFNNLLSRFHTEGEHKATRFLIGLCQEPKNSLLYNLLTENDLLSLIDKDIKAIIHSTGAIKTGIYHANQALSPIQKRKLIQEFLEYFPADQMRERALSYIAFSENNHQAFLAEILRSRQTPPISHTEVADYYSKMEGDHTSLIAKHNSMASFWRNAPGLKSQSAHDDILLPKIAWLPASVTFKNLNKNMGLEELAKVILFCARHNNLHETRRELQKKFGINNADICALIRNLFFKMHKHEISSYYTNDDYKEYAQLGTYFMNAYKADLQKYGLSQVNEKIKVLENSIQKLNQEPEIPENTKKLQDLSRKQAFLRDYQQTVLDLYTKGKPPSKNQEIIFAKMTARLLKDPVDNNGLRKLAKEFEASQSWTPRSLFAKKPLSPLSALINTYAPPQRPLEQKQTVAP